MIGPQQALKLGWNKLREEGAAEDNWPAVCTLTITHSHRRTKGVFTFLQVFDVNEYKKPNCLSLKHFRKYKYIIIISLNSIVIIASYYTSIKMGLRNYQCPAL